jgi:hypothetical protein
MEDNNLNIYTLERSAIFENKFIYSYIHNFSEILTKFSINQQDFFRFESKLSNCTKNMLKNKFSIYYRITIFLMILMWLFYFFGGYSSDFRNIIVIPYTLIILIISISFFIYSFTKLHKRMVSKAKALVDIENKKYERIQFKLEEFELNLEIINITDTTRENDATDRSQHDILQEIVLIQDVFNSTSIEELKDLCLEGRHDVAEIKDICSSVIKQASSMANENRYINLIIVVLYFFSLILLNFDLFLYKSTGEQLFGKVFNILLISLLAVAFFINRRCNLNKKLWNSLETRNNEFKCYGVYIDSTTYFGELYVYVFDKEFIIDDYKDDELTRKYLI